MEQSKKEAPIVAEDESKETDRLFALARHMTLKTLMPGKKGAAQELALRVIAVAEEVIGRFEKKEPLNESLACRAGCAYCCHYQAA